MFPGGVGSKRSDVDDVSRWPENPAANLKVEPIQREVGEGVADQSGSSSQQMIAPQSAGQPDAQDHLQAEKGITAAEHSGSDATGSLSWSSLLRPEPANAPADAPATDLNQPAHGQVSRMMILVINSVLSRSS